MQKQQRPLPVCQWDREKAFVATFRKALEEKDKKTMDSLLLKEDTPAQILELFQMILELPPDTIVNTVELMIPSAEDAATYRGTMEVADGKNYKLPIIPYKQLLIVMTEGASNTTKSTLPVAEKDGKFVIPMPMPIPAA